ncbi:hypothetical protein O3P69_010890 [Scylla paramamosain]|uniref:NACHT domain-containing protein n=2 Tax=Scylla paramamosain TaxID=85552 RepID=A0AAW0TFP5_SCYPA
MSDKCCKFNRDRVNNFLEVGRQDVLFSIFTWGTPNKSDATPLDQYLKQLPPSSTANFPKLSCKQRSFSNIELHQIQSDSTCATFDISFLYKAIKLACENVGDYNDESVWKTPSNIMEYYITAIKDERNNSMHGMRDITTQEFLNTAAKLRTLFHEALRTAKMRYKISDAELNGKIKNINDKLDKAMLEVLGEEDLLSFYIAQLRQDLIQETNKVLRKHFLNSLNIDPMSFLTDTKLKLHVEKVFTEIIVTRASTGVRRYLRYENLIKDARSGPESSQPQILLVEGIAGSGKTTFVTLVTGEWLKDSKDRIVTGLDYYDLLLRIQCRERKITSLNCLLKNEVPDVFLKFRTLILPLIKNCKILILVDGLDESNEDSEKLIDDILTQMKTVKGCTLMFTSRPEGVTSFKNKIPLDYQVSYVKLIGIPEACRVAFVRRYHEEIKHQIGDTQNTEKLVENVQQVLEKEHFRLPLNMVFLTWVYIYDPCAITTTTTQTQLYHNTYQLCLQKLLNRLACNTITRNSDRQTLETDLKQPMGAIQKESLLALWRSRVTFDHEAEVRIRNSCLKQNIPPNELLSAFLTLKANRTHLGTIIQYSAPHKGLQEFYAAMHIATHPKLKTSSASIRSVLQETLGKLDENLGRIQNVLYHVAGMLHLPPNTSTVSETITNEVLDMLFDSGMNVREKWLDLVEDTRGNIAVLHRVAPYFVASIPERHMIEQLEEKLVGQKEKEEQKRQEEERKKKEEEEEREEEMRKKELEEKTGNKKMEVKEEHINVNKKKEEQEKEMKERKEEKGKKKENIEEMEMKEDNYYVKEDGMKKKTMEESYSDKDGNILPVLIGDIRLERLIALLPLLPPCDVCIEFEKDPGLHMESLLSAISRHTCISVTVMSHFKEPDPAVNSDYLMRQVLPRCQLEGFIGNLTDNSIRLLPPSLQTLSLAVTGDDHIAGILSALHFHKLPSLLDFRIHVPVAKVTSSSLNPVLVGGEDKTIKIFLFLSGVNDQLIEEACRVVKALQCRTGYEAIIFPRASASCGGWRKLLESLAEKGVRVNGSVFVTGNNETEEICEDDQLNILATARLGCEFGRADDQNLWLF